MLDTLVFCDISEVGAYDLEFDCLSVKVDGTDFKIDTYCAEITFRVGILSEPQEQTRLIPKTFSSLGAIVARESYLSHSRITDEEDFEEKVIVVGHFR